MLAGNLRNSFTTINVNPDIVIDFITFDILEITTHRQVLKAQIRQKITHAYSPIYGICTFCYRGSRCSRRGMVHSEGPE